MRAIGVTVQMPPEIAREARRQKTVTVDGVDITYDTTGTGPAVVCIQGVGVAGAGWRPQVEALARRFRMVTIDNRGIGRSAAAPEPLTIEAMARDVLAVMDAEGLDRCHVMGHSMGGLIGQQVALLAPARVKSLALLCTFGDGAAATRLSPRMLLLGLRARAGTRAMRRNGMLRMIMPAAYLRSVDRPALARDLQQLFGRDLADQPPIVGRQLQAMSRCSLTARLRELSGIPTLVLGGTHDPIAPPALGRALAAAIGGARFVEIPEASHALPIQCAGAVNIVLMQHWSRAEGRSAALAR